MSAPIAGEVTQVAMAFVGAVTTLMTSCQSSNMGFDATCLQSVITPTTLQTSLNSVATQQLQALSSMYNISSGTDAYNDLTNSLNNLGTSIANVSQSCIPTLLQQPPAQQNVSIVSNCILSSPQVNSAISNLQQVLIQAIQASSTTPIVPSSLCAPPPPCPSCPPPPSCPTPPPCPSPKKPSIVPWIIVGVLGFLVLALGIGLIVSFVLR